VPLDHDGTKVKVVAVDQAGKTGTLDFLLKPEEMRGTATAAIPQGQAGDEPAVLPGPQGAFGKYYALVIGNNAYQQLPKLSTPTPDAEAVAQVLQSKYGFNVTVLKDANRYAILEALNKMREQLTENDNLLIYYAGHGELDKVNQRGNWLPVDAEPNSSAN